MTGSVVNTVGRDEALDLLGRVIPIKCEPEALGIDEREAVKFYGERMAEFGMEVEVFEVVANRPNVVGRLRGTGGGKSILLNTHLLAPITPLEDWATDPYKMTVVDGKIYGMAVSDTKAGIVAMLLAARNLAKQRPRGDVIIGLGAGGEKGGFIGTKAIVDHGYRTDVAVVCEPSDLDIIHVQYGALWPTFTVKGKQGFVDAGVSALHKGVVVYRALLDMNKTLNQRVHPLLPPSKIAVNSLHSGIHWALVPDRCEIKADRRIIPGETPASARAEFDALLDSLRSADPALDVSYQIDVELPPIETPADSLIVQTAAQAIREVRGAEPKLKGIRGFTEMVHIHQAGVPAIVCGPANASVLHAPNEYVTVAEFIDSIAVYTRLAGRIANMAA